MQTHVDLHNPTKKRPQTERKSWYCGIIGLRMFPCPKTWLSKHYRTTYLDYVETRTLRAGFDALYHDN